MPVWGKVFSGTCGAAFSRRAAGWIVISGKCRNRGRPTATRSVAFASPALFNVGEEGRSKLKLYGTACADALGKSSTAMTNRFESSTASCQSEIYVGRAGSMRPTTSP